MGARLDAQEALPTRYIESENGRTPEPIFDSKWTELEQLTWKASLVMAENPGVRIYVFQSEDRRREYNLSWNSGGMSSAVYHDVWEILNGISVGLYIASQLPTTKE